MYVNEADNPNIIALRAAEKALRVLKENSLDYLTAVLENIQEFYILQIYFIAIILGLSS